MTLTPLSAISPIDGRYRNTTSKLADYFSEYALIKYRVFVEIEYFLALCLHPLPQLRDFDKSVSEKLRAIYQNFSEKELTKHHGHLYTIAIETNEPHPRAEEATSSGVESWKLGAKCGGTGSQTS